MENLDNNISNKFDAYVKMEKGEVISRLLKNEAKLEMLQQQNATSGKYTSKDEIMNIKDNAERLKAIQKNMHLFNK